MYDTYATKFYDDRYVECFNLKFKESFELRLKEIEHSTLLTEWTRNIEKYAYKKRLIKNTQKP